MGEYNDELEARAAVWMEAIAPLQAVTFDLDWDAAALLVVDMQRVFLDGSSKVQDAEAVMRRVGDLVRAFQDRGRPVIYTRHLHRDDGSDGGNLLWWWGSIIRESSEGGQLHPVIAPEGDEAVVRKNTYDAFQGTDLQERLDKAGVRDLVVCGVMTNLCCETSAREAFCRGYRVKFVADGTGTAADPMQIATLVNLSYGFAQVVLAEEILEEGTDQSSGGSP
jgi:nicotinamidase-related amidase